MDSLASQFHVDQFLQLWSKIGAQNHKNAKNGLINEGLPPLCRPFFCIFAILGANFGPQLKKLVHVKLTSS